MTFYFDCRFIRNDHHDGISRFSSELFTAVSKKTEVIALISSQDQLGQLPPGTKHLLVNDPKNPWLEFWLPRRLNGCGATVVFSPMQTMGSLGKKYKLILTLHDLIYYRHRRPPSFLSWPIRLTWRLFHLSYTPVRLLLNRADSVVTISQTTKNLMTANRLTRRPITVISNASSMPAVAVSKKGPKSKNLVYMGSFMPYKNVETLVLAMQQLPEYTLTLCSKISSQRRNQLLAVAKGAAKQIKFLDGVSESQYLEVLDDSFALVSASRDEGFGIPVIEAMSRAIPVVISDIKIFLEVAEDAGIFFNPESSDQFAKAVRKLEPLSFWQRSSLKSLEQSKHYSWEDSGKELFAIVESVRS